MFERSKYSTLILVNFGLYMYHFANLRLYHATYVSANAFFYVNARLYQLTLYQFVI
jgi:hypothetical protein